MAGISGYRSPVNLPIGQVPLTTSPDLFNELTEVYNSIHLINQYLDKLRISIGGGGSGQTPDETMPFSRFFAATALENTTAGMAVSSSSIVGENGVIPGAMSSNYGSSSASSLFCGIALTDALLGQPLRVGVGPAAIAVPGAVPGNYIWAYSGLNTGGGHFKNGTIYPYYPGGSSTVNGTSYPVPIGIAITPGYALVF